jgi:phosphinothricin acetyltransferase
MDLIIDNLTVDDWEQVRAIYLEGIRAGQATFEITAPTWDQFDADHLTECRLIARAQNQIIGWAVLSPVSRRKAYEGVAEVSVYVAKNYQGRGVGKTLLCTIIDMSERFGIWMLQGATFPENTASLRLQERCGFRVVGRRERIARQHGVWRDTIITERRSQLVGLD